MPVGPPTPAVVCRFQSTPAITGGRCGPGSSAPPRWRCFNPRPPLLAGDALAGGVSHEHQPVSIHARHYWRAMRHGHRCHRHQSCFNPRPPLLAGDACASMYSCVSAALPVSIHARHYWRAMPLYAEKRARSPKRFNPRPPLLAGDASIPAHAVPLKKFQSTPAITGGRCRLMQTPQFILGLVSIHARHYWRAMPSHTVSVP